MVVGESPAQVRSALFRVARTRNTRDTDDLAPRPCLILAWLESFELDLVLLHEPWWRCRRVQHLYLGLGLLIYFSRSVGRDEGKWDEGEVVEAHGEGTR